MQGELRYIFPATIVLLWVLFGLAISAGSWTPVQWLILGLAHVLCAVIFVNFVYVFNYGYALSMLVISLALLALMPSLAAALVAGSSALFGLRLLQFTHARYRGQAYAGNLERQRKASAAMPLPVKIFLWIAVSWLMGFQAMPVYFVAVSGTLTGWVIAGTALMLVGLVVEALADVQKQAAKAQKPGAFVDAGLFRIARHPNYLGEILFQAGYIGAVLGSVSGWQQYAMAIAAPAYVIVLMCFAGRNADRDQQERYGKDPAWAEYRRRTGRFLPGGNQGQ
jgi:steroid 5-alpha reductase family enzyme